jgi:hypothetical protein
MNYFIEAVHALYPQVIRTVGEEAFDADGKPVAYDRAAVEALVNATAYQRQRQPEYPSLAELADALYWASTGDTTKLDAYYAACAAVKAKYPKPEVTP